MKSRVHKKMAEIIKSANDSTAEPAQKHLADVVRCRDCAYRHTTFCLMSVYVHKPYSYSEWTRDDMFCSRGREK